MTAEAAWVIGGVCGAAGLAYLAAAVNGITAVLGALSIGSYLFVYTPLKRITTLNTVVGAMAGALPPLMGWTAARGEMSREGWSLFAILCFWQLPHFLAIAWMYRDDYARAGFVMLPVADPGGERTGRRALSHTLGLLPVSLCPFLFKMAGPVYLAGACALGIGFIWCAHAFSRQLTMRRARALFFASIIYLPSLLGLMVLDKG
jgi:protoheme IX farnesyltransferase